MMQAMSQERGWFLNLNWWDHGVAHAKPLITEKRETDSSYRQNSKGPECQIFKRAFDSFWSAYVLRNERELNCGNQSQTQGKHPINKESNRSICDVSHIHFNAQPERNGPLEQIAINPQSLGGRGTLLASRTSLSCWLIPKQAVNQLAREEWATSPRCCPGRELAWTQAQAESFQE